MCIMHSLTSPTKFVLFLCTEWVKKREREKGVEGGTGGLLLMVLCCNYSLEKYLFAVAVVNL